MTNTNQLPTLLEGQAAEVTKQLQDLDTQLLVLRLSVGKLKAALERCFAPLAAVLLPPVHRAIRTLTAWFSDAAAVLAELFGFVRRSADKTVTHSGKALRRTLAGFDQLERLAGSSGGGSTVVPGELLEFPERLRPIVDKIRALLKPLQDIDFSAAAEAFARLRAAVEPITRSLFDALEWVWFNVLTPMAQWGAEQLLPAFLDTLASAFRLLNAALQAVRPLLDWLWSDILLPMGQWAGTQLLTSLQSLSVRLDTLTAGLENGDARVQLLVDRLRLLKERLFGTGEQVGLFNTLLTPFREGLSRIKTVAEGICTAFSNVAAAVGTVRTTLSTLLTGLPNGFRVLANGLISLLNTAITAAENGINAVVRTLNAFRVDIPAWVPGLGGKSFSISARTIDLPSIPYLAKGAVLPANRPFLAVVGDQRTGTNIEAPLSLIQEAVRGELGGCMAGFEATLEVQRQILDAILGIELGDTTIGQAAQRYTTAQNILRGGYV